MGFKKLKMANTQGVPGSVKRFGARYGRKLRRKVGIIELSSRGFHKCPYCHKVKAKRLATGIWECTKCNSKFAGKAYSIASFKPQARASATTEEVEVKEEV